MTLWNFKKLIHEMGSWQKINPETYREDKLQKYLDLLSCDYQYFKDLDKKMNENYKGLSRLRFNPLSIYPVIKTQKKYLKRDSIYIIPNYNLFSLKVTEGLFWFFIDYYSKKDLITYKAAKKTA